MDTTRPISPSTALSSFPITKMASTSSVNMDRCGATTLDEPISESSKTPRRKASNSSHQSTLQSLSGQAMRPYRPNDFLKLEADRESVINLAKFLRTTEPPPGNYMSLPDNGPRYSQDRKLPFKMLRRQTSKRSSDPIFKTLRLPDSAVAAKTKQGHWHIAISIPVEYDHQEPAKLTQNKTTKHLKTQSEAAIRNGHITVLKPAIGDVRPAIVSTMPTKSQSHDDLRHTFTIVRPLSVPSLPATGLGRDLQNISLQEVKQDAFVTFKDGQTRSDRPFDHKGVVCTGEQTRPESQRSEMRKSEDTCFTARSLDSNLGHTRGQSSISTAPSISYPASPRAAWPPQKRTGGPDQAIDQDDHSLLAQLPQSAVPTRVNGSLRPISAGSDISSGNLKIAATAQGYGPDMPGTQLVFVRKTPQTAGYRARIAKRPLKNSSAEYILSSQRSMSYDNQAAAPNSMEMGATAKPRQSRQERVKAIRSRDMAKLRAMKKYQQVMASVTASEAVSEAGVIPRNQTQAESYRQPSQKRSLSCVSIAEETTWQKPFGSWSPVMIVANIEPSVTSSELYALFSCLPTRRLPAKEVKMSEKYSAEEAQTPHCPVPSSINSSDEEEVDKENSQEEMQISPQSITSSPVTSDTETVHSLKPRPRKSNTANSYRFGSIDNCPGDTRPQNTKTEESMDTRIRRLETINAVIFRTLNAVVEMGVGFRELRQLLPAEPTESDKAQFHKRYSSQSVDDRDPVGSLIRELRGAVKIGQEELAKYGAAV